MRDLMRANALGQPVYWIQWTPQERAEKLAKRRGAKGAKGTPKSWEDGEIPKNWKEVDEVIEGIKNEYTNKGKVQHAAWSDQGYAAQRVWWQGPSWAWDGRDWQWSHPERGSSSHEPKWKGSGGGGWSWHEHDWHGHDQAASSGYQPQSQHYWQGASSGYQPENQPHPLGSFGVAPLAPPQTVVPNASGPVPRGQFGAAPVPQDAPGNPFPLVPQAAPPPPAHDKGDLGNEWFDFEEGELESEEGSGTEITNRGSKGYEPQYEP